MKANKTLMAGALAAALFTIGAQAAETVQTEDVKVTATRVEKDLADVNMSVTVITAEDIKRSTARNIGELLQDVPGVEINPDGGQGMKRVNIRGENSFRTVIMIDGNRVSEHKSMSGAPMLIDPSQVERIEVIKGPASVLYGSDAIGGAINIITKKGGEKAVQGNVAAGYTTQSDGVSASAGLFGAANGWKYRLNASYEDHDDLDTPVGKMPNTDFNTKSASMFVSYDLDADTTVGATVEHFDMEFHSATVGNDSFKVDVDEWTRTRAATFAEMRNVGDNLQRLRVDAFYQTSGKQFVNTMGEMMPGMLFQPGADNTMDQYGLSVQSDWQLGDKNYLVAGYEFNYDDLDANSFSHMSGASSHGSSAPFRMTTKDELYKGHQMTHAIYGSMETEMDNGITFNYGARYTYVDSECDTSVLANNFISKEPKGTKKHGSSDDGKVVFNAGVLYNGIDNLTLRASWAQGYRFPLLQDLYIPAEMGGTKRLVWGNPDLKPETSNNFEIGARWNDGRTKVDAVIFYSLAKDYIARTFSKEIQIPGARPQPGMDPVMVTKEIWQPQNVDEAKTIGLELSAFTMLGQTNFEPYVNLTLMKRQYDSGNHKTWDTGTPLVTAVYGMRWAGEQNGLGVRWDAYARSQSSSKLSNATGTVYELGGYTTFNLKGGIDFGAQKQYTVDFGLYNVFDKLYMHQEAIYEPGRYAAIKFNAAF